MGTKRAHFRFYAELKDILPPDKRSGRITRSFELDASVKDMIEAFGVPHTEVDVILVNGESVDFSHRVHDGDRISVYPVFESFDISPLLKVRSEPLREPRFVLDAHLGRLARYLRLLGFDSLYENDLGDRELARISADERRILLTRDLGILKRKKITHGYYVRETQPRVQLSEVVRRFDLLAKMAPFSRCMRCNGELQVADKEAVADRLPEGTERHFDDFRICSHCEQVYWKGAHFERLSKLIEDVRSSADVTESGHGSA